MSCEWIELKPQVEWCQQATINSLLHTSVSYMQYHRCVVSKDRIICLVVVVVVVATQMIDTIRQHCLSLCPLSVVGREQR